jgi:hypothetical protein
MNHAQRERLVSLISQRLIEALEAENPSAALIKEAMAWLQKIEAGDIKTQESEERTEELRSKVTRLPFPAPALTAPTEAAHQ